MPTKKKFYCHKCGVELTNSNCRKANNSVTGYSYLCISCEELRLKELAEMQGIYEALYSQCSALDIPLVPRVLDAVDLTTLESPWRAYLRLLKDNGEYLVDGELRGFKDGIQSIFGVFGTNLNHTDFKERIKQDVAKIQAERKRKRDEEERLAKLPGTEEQRERWGVEPLYISQNTRIPKLVMTQAVYDELDRIYTNRAEALKGTTITPQIDFTLQEVAKNTVIYSHQRRYGERDKDKTWKDIDSMLASEQLRKKDEKPVEMFRMDALITELEKFGCMENGDFLSYDELIKVMQDKFVKSKKYDYSLDAADQMILDILNAMRKNADLLELSDLPAEFAVVDEYGEFEPEETEEEKKRKQFAQTPKVQVVDENGNPTTEKKTATKKNSKKE